MVSASDIRAEGLYPQPGRIDCIIEDEWQGDNEKIFVRVSTEKPWSIESIAGETVFTVLKDQVLFG